MGGKKQIINALTAYTFFSNVWSSNSIMVMISLVKSMEEGDNFSSESSVEGTSTILSPGFKVPFFPAGLSSRTCLMKMPLITSPLLSRLPIPRPPTMLMPKDLLGSLQSSTL